MAVTSASLRHVTRSFTLIELLVVVAIAKLLFALKPGLKPLTLGTRAPRRRSAARAGTTQYSTKKNPANLLCQRIRVAIDSRVVPRVKPVQHSSDL